MASSKRCGGAPMQRRKSFWAPTSHRFYPGSFCNHSTWVLYKYWQHKGCTKSKCIQQQQQQQQQKMNAAASSKQLQHFVAKPEMHYSLLATDMRGSKLASFCGFTLHWVSWLFQGYKDVLLCTSLSKILLRVSELQDLGVFFDNASILGNASVVCIFSLSHTLRDLRFDLMRCLLCVWVFFLF